MPNAILPDSGIAAPTLLVLAPVIGSFLGVVVRRLPEGRAIVWSRSQCEACKATLHIRDLVPLVSWLVARGRCRYCGQKLGLFYPGIEIIALVIALISLLCDDFPRVWLDCLLGWWLLALAWIDLRNWLLPDSLTLPLLVLGLIVAVWLDPDALFDRALGAALGYLVLRAVALAYRAIRRREGLGGGDAKLLGAAGAWVGASALPQVVLAASLAALAAAAVLHRRGSPLTAQSALPFGPFIGIAMWIVWLSLPHSL